MTLRSATLMKYSASHRRDGDHSPSLGYPRAEISLYTYNISAEWMNGFDTTIFCYITSA